MCIHRVLVVLALFCFILTPYSSKARDMNVNNELSDIQESIRDFISSFSIRDTIENSSPTTIIVLCIAAVVLAIVFRGLIFFVIMLGVLVMMFGSTQKVIDYLEETLNIGQDIGVQSKSTQDEDVNKKEK
nr:hypothetical protein [Wolbachia endosymbiont of Ctenocephalides felis wCfeT]